MIVEAKSHTGRCMGYGLWVVGCVLCVISLGLLKVLYSYFTDGPIQWCHTFFSFKQKLASLFYLIYQANRNKICTFHHMNNWRYDKILHYLHTRPTTHNWPTQSCQWDNLLISFDSPAVEESFHSNGLSHFQGKMFWEY